MRPAAAGSPPPPGGTRPPARPTQGPQTQAPGRSPQGPPAQSAPQQGPSQQVVPGQRPSTGATAPGPQTDPAASAPTEQRAQQPASPRSQNPPGAPTSPGVQPPAGVQPAPRPTAAEPPPTQAAPTVKGVPERPRETPSAAAAPESASAPLDPQRAGGQQPSTTALPKERTDSAGPPDGAGADRSAQGAPPWQRGQVQGQGQHETARRAQNQPQTNLSTRTGALPAGSPADGPVTPTAQARGESPRGESQGAKAQRREDAKSKAAVIDGPTRHIERKDLAKDMPDLSSVRHPAPSSEAQKAPAPVAVAARVEGEPLRATIQIRKIDPWSTLKISLVIAVSLFFVWMVAVGLLYAVLDGMGVWDRLNSAFTEIVNEDGGGGLVSAGQVFGYAAVIGILNVVLFTALTTIGSFIYNLSSDLVGGVEVTLADRD
ncbi:hypothetical protein E5720_10205 [Rhodococcus sp. PAMC28707]|nr:hypothetical protein E5769_03810 [Rhodococcus sp. PAMC28705]QCB60928.1 hypothetical protein E5720_10205 [Rhodococcus sp. PAMC28707]